MDPYTTIALYCPIHDVPGRSLLVTPDELAAADGFIACDTCGDPMRPVNPFPIIEEPITHELHLFDPRAHLLYRLDGTPLQAHPTACAWAVHGRVSHLYDWQDAPHSEPLRRYTVATLAHSNPRNTFTAGGGSLFIKAWAAEHSFTVVSPRSFATRQSARDYAEAHGGIAW